MTDYQTILVETRGRVGWITLNRPEALNALNSQVMSDVVAAAEAFDADEAIGAIVEACGDWQIVTEIAPDAFIVQHRGKGPHYRLTVVADDWLPSASLQREPPRWSCDICLQERGGYRSYVLEWPTGDEADATTSVALRAATWERAESEAAFWIANHAPEMYGQVSFRRIG